MFAGVEMLHNLFIETFTDFAQYRSCMVQGYAFCIQGMRVAPSKLIPTRFSIFRQFDLIINQSQVSKEGENSSNPQIFQNYFLHRLDLSGGMG
jgi:hypothetical protein